MLRKHKKLRLPWVGNFEADHFMIRDSFGVIVAVVPPHVIEQINLGNFIIRATNKTAIKDTLLNKVENVAIVFSSTILLLVGITILIGIDYAPILILGGGILTAVCYIYNLRIAS